MKYYKYHLRILLHLIIGILLPNVLYSQAQYSATVSHDEIKISFPIDDDSENSFWRWNLTTTRINALEYQYSAIVTIDTNKYKFGYFLFKHPLSQQKSGNFNDLLKSGQLSIWQVKSKASSLIKEGKFTTSVAGNQFNISIAGS